MEKIVWMDWGEQAFARAQGEDKPLLLDLDATWCHWCHVMEQTTYSDPEVVRLVSEGFVPVRVDPDRRPDINDRYNQGGWPTTAFLAPGGELLFGATYLPPEQMREVLKRLQEFWQTQKQEIGGALAAHRAEIMARRIPQAESGPASAEALEITLESMREQFDSVLGGFGSASSGFAPKFPYPEAVELCLLQYTLTGDEQARDMARKTLEGMLALEDMEEGGFFRYAVQRDWSQPHYEKMLQTNAALLRVYLEAWRVLGDPLYRQAASGIVRWVRSTMCGEKGGLRGSQEADGEAAYYDLRQADRAHLPRPATDPTIFCDWNAEMARSLLEAFLLLGEEECLQTARGAMGFLLAEGRQPGGPMFHYWSEGRAHVPGLLRDQAQMILTLCCFYQVTAEGHYLKAAEELARWVLDNLEDKVGGGFHDFPASSESTGGPLLPRKGILENSAVAAGLARLACLTSNQDYRLAAKRALGLFSQEYAGLGAFGAPYALASWFYNHAQTSVVVVGKKDDFLARRLLLEALEATPCSARMAWLLDPEEQRDRLQQLGLPEQENAMAYVCRGEECQAIDQPGDLFRVLRGIGRGDQPLSSSSSEGFARCI